MSSSNLTALPVAATKPPARIPARSFVRMTSCKLSTDDRLAILSRQLQRGSITPKSAHVIGQRLLADIMKEAT